ncbi:MAG: tyrosine--tRNA ligase [Anaerolineae bacterium]|nr:tyrosine--tRNA ligase [Anaerolineae bacterium]
MDLEQLLTRGVAEVIVREELEERLRSGEKLRLKQGFDPSKPDLHIGHAVGLRKLRQFQDLGHVVVLVVGDWTAQIGDPSGRDESRQMLSREEVLANAETYMNQFFKVVDRERTEVRWQSEWYEGFSLADVLDLTSRFTLAQMMAHDTFRRRYENGLPITLMELMYPLLQAYDSVMIRADVEFGGTDQKFNNLAGRELQAAMGQRPQDVLLVPLLLGTDGRKMSKSFGNTIDLDDPPEEMYGKVMSLADGVLFDYFWLVTDVPEEEIAAMKKAISEGANPRDLKMRLAREIVTQMHSAEAAQKAEAEFVRVFQRQELPEDMPEVRVPQGATVMDAIVTAELAGSRSEARRLIEQGGVYLDGDRVEALDTAVSFADGSRVLRVGRRRFVRLLPA